MKNRITIGKRLLIGVLYLSTLIPVSFAQIKGKVIDASMDIAGSPLKNIGTANDVLAKQPFIVKDGDGIKVMGKGKPLISINNRLVRSDNELEKLSSGNIKKVTVITSPGPEYDATVSSVVLIEATRPPGGRDGSQLLVL